MTRKITLACVLHVEVEKELNNALKAHQLRESLLCV